MHGAFAMVKETLAQDPAYRPAHPFCQADLRRSTCDKKPGAHGLHAWVSTEVTSSI
jgi:hypothetical protein